MPDIQMCPEDTCPYSKQCKRHPDSGTVASKYQAWGFFEKAGPMDNPRNCDGWWPIKGDKCPIKEDGDDESI